MTTTLSRPLLTTALLASLAAATPILGAAPAFAQTKPAEAPEAGKEIALTQGLIDGLVAAQPELAKLTGAASETPDPKAEAQAQAQAEAIVKRNGFSSLEAFQDTSDTVDAVLDGVDPETRTYVGARALLEKQLAAVQADPKIPAKEKAATIKEIRDALAEGDTAKPSQANIALVTKNYTRLGAASAEAGPSN